MQSFPLLHLPSLALKESLKCLNPIELFTLSQCSIKTMDTIKLAGTRNFKLSTYFGHERITINDTYYFEIFERDDITDDLEVKGDRTFHFKGVKMIVPVAQDLDNENTLLCYWEDEFVGMRATCFHLIHIFGCKMDYLEIVDDLSLEKIQSIIGDVLEKQDEIPNIHIWLKEFTDEDLKWILDTLKVTENLYIHFEPSGSFEYNFKTLPKFIFIDNAFWFTLDNLLSLHSCKIIELYTSTLTNKDLDVFICLWKTGKYPNLEYLEVSSDQLNDKEMIGGLTSMINTVNPTVREKSINGVVCKIFNGVDIQRDDEIIATIELDAEAKCFQLLVWTN